MKNILNIVLLAMAVAGLAAAGTTTYAAPEIGVAGGVSAVGIIAGCLLIARSRRKK